MKLSVVILNYNVKHFLQLCLQSVKAATVNIDSEIIVIDNASTDGSQQMVNAFFSEVKWIQNTNNVGFSKANNQAVKEAKGEYLCILNPDTVVPEDCFTKLLDFSQSKPNVGIVACQLIDGKGQFLPESKRNVPTPKVALQKIIGNSQAYYANHINKDETGVVSVFVGAFMLLKKEIYQEVGGFDERYFMYGEDIDLSYKIEKAGYGNYYKGDVTVIHYKGESTLKNKVYAKRFYGAMTIFYKTHFRKNFLFDVVVSLSTNILPLLKKGTNDEEELVNEYVFLSNRLLPNLQIALKKPILVSSHHLKDKQGVQYIYDGNIMSFKSIIDKMKLANKTPLTSFKILPKNTNFVIGSNSSENKGEIFHF